MVSPAAIDGSPTHATRAGTLARLARRLTPPILLVAAAIALFLTSPTAGDFSWSDAPRHALNGVFVKDFIAAMPWHDPARWAANYYLQYPALSILFYPPLFYFVEAAFFAVFGVSHATAQLTVAAFYLALGFGGYRLARLWMSRFTALGSALLLMGAPAIAFWGRQVMLDIPACALLVWGAYCFVRFLDASKTRDLACAVALLLASLYTKYNVVFVAPVLLAALIAARGRPSLRDRRVIIAAVLAAIGIVPALLLNLKFGVANFQSVADHPGEFSRWSIDAWLFYPELLPALLGWPAVIAGVAGVVLLLTKRLPRMKAGAGVLLLGWILLGYVFFTVISVREPRHVLTAVLPLTIFAGLAIDRLLPRRAAGLVAVALGIGTLAWSIAYDPVPIITGHQQMADYAADHTPPNSVVLFSGYRDGNFVFDIRAREDRRDLTVIRADKLLLRIAVERPRGVGQADLNEDEIVAMIRKLGIGLIVAQDDFWQDLTEMKRLSDALKRPEFTPIAHFDITGTMGHEDKSFTLYKPTYPVTPPAAPLSIEMPIFNGKFEGGKSQGNDSALR